MIKMQKNFISVYLSGGVDSFFCVLILKYLKYKIIGIHILNWINNKSIIIKLINKISKLINIKIIFFNFKNIYKKKIFYLFLKNYNNKKFINLDIYCNKIIKFFIIIKILNKKKINKFFSGHFSKNFFKNKKIFWKLCFDFNRDQNLFIYKIKKKSDIIFIMYENYKITLKKIFLNNYKSYTNNSSKGICFIENSNNIKLIIRNFIYLKIKINLIKNLKKVYKLNFFKKINWYKNLIILKNNFLKKKIKNNRYIKFKTQNNKYYKICLFKYFKKTSYFIFKKKHKIQKGQDIVFYYKKICLGGFLII